MEIISPPSYRGDEEERNGRDTRAEAEPGAAVEDRGCGRRGEPLGPGRDGAGRVRLAELGVGPAAGPRLGWLRQRRWTGHVLRVREGPSAQQAAAHLHGQPVRR